MSSHVKPHNAEDGDVCKTSALTREWGTPTVDEGNRYWTDPDTGNMAVDIGNGFAKVFSPAFNNDWRN
jgi:hypothetical protein